MLDNLPIKQIETVTQTEDATVITRPALTISMMEKYPAEYGTIFVGVEVTRMNASDAGHSIPTHPFRRPQGFSSKTFASKDLRFLFAGRLGGICHRNGGRKFGHGDPQVWMILQQRAGEFVRDRSQEGSPPQAGVPIPHEGAMEVL